MEKMYFHLKIVFFGILKDYWLVLLFMGIYLLKKLKFRKENKNLKLVYY